MPAAKVITSVEDQSARVTSTGTYNTAIVIEAKKGPIDKPVRVTSQSDFLRKFTPNERIELGWDLAHFEAYKYLEQQNGLYVVRAAHIDDLDGEDEDYPVLTSGCILKAASAEGDNKSFEEEQGLTYTQFKAVEDLAAYDFTQGDVALLYASSPGLHGDNISIQVKTNEKIVKVAGAFQLNVFKNDVMVEQHICSLDPALRNGYGVNCSLDKVLQSSLYIRGLVNTALELTEIAYSVNTVIDGKTYVGYTSVKADKGSSIALSEVYANQYLQTKLQDTISQTIVEKINKAYETYQKTPESPEVGTNGEKMYPLRYTGKSVTHYVLPKETLNADGSYTTVDLKGGSDGSIVLMSDRIRALNTLRNMQECNFQLVLDGGNTTTEYANAIASLCNARDESCHGIISTAYEDEIASDPVTAITNYRNLELNINNYSMELYTPHQKYYDEFNDRYLWLSPGPYVASLIMETAQIRGWHWAVAGYNRGIVDSIDVANSFEMTQVDEFSDAQINTIIKDPGSGNVIWEDLTLWSQAADLQDAHISRWINIYLRPSLKELLKGFLFEFNDEETRALVVQKITNFMLPLQSARACYSFRVVCDETNNLPDDIENNRMNSWLYVKPTKLAKEIRQKIVLVPYAVDLDTLEV